MIVVKDTSLEIGWRTWPIAPPTWSLILLVKATFDLPAEGGPCSLSAKQAQLRGDRYEDDDPEGPLRYASDWGLPKPRAEAYLVGTAHAPRGRPVTSLLVAFRVGSLAKELAVIGDRHWQGGLLGGMSEPAPFTSMPLGWERCFGGRGSKANPFGRGLDPVLVDGQPRYPLPNIEDRTHMLRSSQAAPAPYGAFPIPPSWPSRVARAGTYDSKWLRRRWPYLPEDASPAYLSDTPEDQRIVGYWRGDEPISLAHLHPERSRIEANLPGIRPRCLVHSAEAEQKTHEVPLALDTIAIDADAMKVYARWQGTHPLRGERPDELAAVFLTHDARRGERSRHDLDRAYAVALAERVREDAAFEPEPMPSGGSTDGR